MLPNVSSSNRPQCDRKLLHRAQRQALTTLSQPHSDQPATHMSLESSPRCLQGVPSTIRAQVRHASAWSNDLPPRPRRKPSPLLAASLVEEAEALPGPRAAHTLSWPTPSNVSEYGKEGRSVASRRTQTIWENVWNLDANDEEKSNNRASLRDPRPRSFRSSAQRLLRPRRLMHVELGDSPWLTKSEIAPRGALDHHGWELAPRYPPRRHVHRRQRRRPPPCTRSIRRVLGCAGPIVSEAGTVLDEMMPENWPGSFRCSSIWGSRLKVRRVPIPDLKLVGTGPRSSILKRDQPSFRSPTSRDSLSVEHRLGATLGWKAPER